MSLGSVQNGTIGLGARVSKQGALLFSGFAVAQLFSFGRNAIIGHWLSKGDFGVAAAITLLLQVIEASSDVGVDRLIVQARDGDRPRLEATCHAMLFLRGLLTGLIMYLLAGPVAEFFLIPETKWAFQAAAIVPVIKGLVHLDPRRFQRRLSNGAQVAVEVLPQATALMLTVPALIFAPGYQAIVLLSFMQAIVAVVTSHLLSRRRYRLAFDRDYATRLINFGWPIWLSAFPLIIANQGDRALVGRLLGMEELAAYTTAFMITMVPGLIVAKVGHALMLPLFAKVVGKPDIFLERFRIMTDLTSLALAGYVAVFVSIGGIVLPLAFGAQYAGLGSIVSLLAVMWAIRMIQAVPGMALMASGQTRPFLVAGLLRSTSLVAGFAALVGGFGLSGLVVAGIAGESLSLVYVALRVCRGRSWAYALVVLSRTAVALSVGVAAGLACVHGVGTGTSSLLSVLGGLLAAFGAFALLAVCFPDIRRLVQDYLRSRSMVAQTA